MIESFYVGYLGINDVPQKTVFEISNLPLTSFVVKANGTKSILSQGIANNSDL